MEGTIRTRPQVGVSIRGDIAEVWREDEQLGLLYQWTIHGHAHKWDGDVLKYRLTGGEGGEVEIRLFLSAPGGAVLTLKAYGHLASDFTADGELHKQAVRLKGTRLEVA